MQPSPPPFASLPADLLQLIAALPLDAPPPEPAASDVCYRSEAFVEDLPAVPAPEPVQRQRQRPRRRPFRWLFVPLPAPTMRPATR